MRRFAIVGMLTTAMLIAVGIAGASTPGADARLTNDCHPDEPCGVGYVSEYTLATGIPYTDATLDECTIAKGRQNEPSVQLDPRDTSVLLGSSNDYCGVYNRGISGGPVGPIWLGYYRSLDGGTNWKSSLVPGYPDDKSPYARLSQARTASAGDPVIAWDNHGRAFFGSESSDDPAGTPKTFGDVWVARFRNPDGPDAPDTKRDGLEYYGTTVVARGSSAPNLLGKFNDKTAIEVDRTGGSCDGNVYFAYSRFSGNSGGVGIYFARSIDHGQTFSNPIEVSKNIQDVQFPDISVTHNGHVYVTFRQFGSKQKPDAVAVAKSTDCGQTFTNPAVIQTFTRSDAQDVRDPEGSAVPQGPVDDPGFEEGADAPGSTARDCGDFSDHCQSGFTFFRRDTQVRSTADQLDLDTQHDWIYIVYDATKDGTVTSSTSTYSSAGTGKVGQAGTYFLRYDGAAGTKVGPNLVDDQGMGHQVFPDISADGGVLHALWWDSRNDTCYSVQRPIGNCENRSTVPSLDVYAATSTNAGDSWTGKTRVTDVTSNPNYEQFDNRQVPFAGDYLWVTSLGGVSYGVWTDWRNTVAGTDPRETLPDPDAGNADVTQCRHQIQLTDKKGNQSFVWSGDTCPHAGGIDQNIYGDKTP